MELDILFRIDQDYFKIIIFDLHDQAENALALFYCNIWINFNCISISNNTTDFH